MMSSILLSICIPVYNRPEQLGVLLSSIDADKKEIEIVISEDRSPAQKKIRSIVFEFRKKSRYNITYFENKTNLGYDGNLRNCIKLAKGEFVLFIGDDDWFVPGAIGNFLGFLKRNSGAGYIFRSYLMERENGEQELFRYFDTEKVFEPGIENAVFLFKRTVSLGGVTFKRTSALRYSTDQFDGLLLYQLYLVAEISLIEKSVACPFPVAIMAQTYRNDNHNFGNSEAEKKYFEPGKVTFQNSINFTKGFISIAEFIDIKYNIDFSVRVKRDISKYSYPFLSIQRKRGIRQFLHYAFQLARQTGINATWHYYLYVIGLIFLGETACDFLILSIKNKLGRTPIL